MFFPRVAMVVHKLFIEITDSIDVYPSLSDCCYASPIAALKQRLGIDRDLACYSGYRGESEVRCVAERHVQQSSGLWPNDLRLSSIAYAT